MRRWLAALLSCFALAAAAGCAGHDPGKPSPGAYAVYYAVTDQHRGAAAVDFEYRELPVGAEPVPELVRQLLLPPGDPGLRSPIPGEVRLLSWRQTGSEVSLDFSEQYGGLSGVELTLADCCVVLTLCQLEGVDSVSITVESHEIPFRHTQTLRASDVLLPGRQDTEYASFSLWFPEEDGTGLESVYCQLPLPEGESLPHFAVSTWLADPARTGFPASQPGEKYLLSAELHGGICTVDLTEKFFRTLDADANRAGLQLRALISTAGALEGVDSVRLLREGQNPGFCGGMDLSGPLLPNLQEHSEQP